MAPATTDLGGERPPGTTPENAAPASDEPVGGQYVTCFVAEECFAFPMESVREIVRLPDTVQVPLAPRTLRGLANLRGAVLPVVDLPELLVNSRAKPTDATRVVVVDDAAPVGLVVDRVERVLTVDPDRIEPAAQVGTAVASDLVAGVIRADSEDDGLIQLLDARGLIAREFGATALETAKTATRGEAPSTLATPAAKDSEEDPDGRQLVGFELDGEAYAFDVEEIREIVRVPDEISRVPGTGDHVLGLVDLRGHAVPLVSLRRSFGLDDSPLAEHNRVLVIGMADEGGRPNTVGLVVDRIQEVFQVSQDALDPVPELLERQGVEGVQALCRLDGGRRLVSLLSAKALFEHPAVQEAVEAHGRQEDVLDSADRCGGPPGESGEEIQLVVFQLAGQEYGIGIQWVQEIIWVPDEMSRVPRTPSFIEGMVNLRGTVLPVVDMRSRFGIERAVRNDQQRILVLDIEGARTGFVVDAMSEVLRVPAQAVEEAPRLSEDQARVMGRVVNLEDQGRMIQVLEANHLLLSDEKESLATAVADATGDAEQPRAT